MCGVGRFLHRTLVQGWGAPVTGRLARWAGQKQCLARWAGQKQCFSWGRGQNNTWHGGQGKHNVQLGGEDKNSDWLGGQDRINVWIGRWGKVNAFLGGQGKQNARCGGQDKHNAQQGQEDKNNEWTGQEHHLAIQTGLCEGVDRSKIGGLLLGQDKAFFFQMDRTKKGLARFTGQTKYLAWLTGKKKILLVGENKNNVCNVTKAKTFFDWVFRME